MSRLSVTSGTNGASFIYASFFPRDSTAFCRSLHTMPRKKGCPITSLEPRLPSRLCGSSSNKRLMKSYASYDISAGIYN